MSNINLIQETGIGEGWEPLLPGLIILLPLLGFFINGVLALWEAKKSAAIIREGNEDTTAGLNSSKAHSWPGWIGPGVIGVAFVLTLINFVRMLEGEASEPIIREYWTWMATGSLEIAAAIQIDQLAIIMVLIITGIGFLIHIFSVGYMHGDPGYPRYFAYLNLFIFFMLILVMGSNYPVMFVGWEGVGLCSYLLIGYWFDQEEKASAGKKAFIVNRIGDFGFLLAVFLLFTNLGTFDYGSIFARGEEVFEYGGPLVTTITLFFLLAAVGKSAQIPLYIWLPDAMAGPTPVSALIHAATMVTAGVYLVARSSLLFAMAPVSSAIVAGIGVFTAFFAATIALKQYDIKKVLAYSTVSQLGYMFLGVGVGAYTAGFFHLITHAFFKALLFLGAGAVIHSMHYALHQTHKDWDAQDIRNMGGLRKCMPITWITMWIATLAISGIWPFAGFFSKDEIIWMTGSIAGADNAPYPGLYTVYWVMALVTAMLTVIYMTRLMIMAFHGMNRTGSKEFGHLHEAPKHMWIPLVVLAVFSVIGGWINVSKDIQQSFLGGFGNIPMAGWLHHWLEPVTESAHHIQEIHWGAISHSAPLGGGEVAWGALSTTAALIVLIVTVWMVRSDKISVATEDSDPRGLSKVIYNKWYVDEFYGHIFIRTLQRLSKFAWRIVDIKIIDRSVGIVAGGMRALGWLASLTQSGQVNTYAFIFTVGILLIFGIVIF